MGSRVDGGRTGVGAAAEYGCRCDDSGLSGPGVGARCLTVRARPAGRCVRGWLALGWLAVAALALAGCWSGSSASGGADGEPPADLPEGQALVSLVSQRGVAHHLGGLRLTTDTYRLQTLDWLKAEDDLVLGGARLARADDGLVVEAMVVNFMSRESQRQNSDMYAWNHSPHECIGEWPPERSLGAVGGPAVGQDWHARLYPVEGLQLKAGDQFAVSVVVRGPEAGRWAAEGVRLRYRQDGEWFQQTANAWSFELYVEEDAADFDGRVCEPSPNEYVDVF